MEGTISTPMNLKPRLWQRGLNYVLQVVWVLALVYIVQLFIFAIRPGYVEVIRVCTEPDCTKSQLTPVGVASLNRLGISLHAYAVIQLIVIYGLAAIYATVSALIFRAKRHDNIAIYVALVLLFFGAFVSDYVDILREVQPQLASLVDILPGLTLIAFTILCYVFPDGRFVPRWTRWAAVGWIAAPVILTIAMMYDAYDAAAGPISVVLLSLLATCIIAPIYRYRRLATRVQREQLKWVLFGLAQLLAMLLIGVELLPLIFPALDVAGTLPNIISFFVQFTSLTIFPITVGISLLRYRLWNVDLVLNRTLVYIPLTSILTVIYTTSLAISQRLFVTATGEQSQAAAIFTTIVLTTTFSPIKNALQGYVDRNFKEAPGNLKELKELDKQVEEVVLALDNRTLARRIVETVVRVHHARGAALYLRDGHAIKLAYATPDWVWVEGEVSILLADDGVTYGRILLGQRSDRDDYTLDEIEDVRESILPIARNIYRLNTLQDAADQFG